MNLIDTFPSFQRFWASGRSLPVEEQTRLWASDYLGAWPELLEKQVACYAGDGLDWEQVAQEKVFPFLSDRLAAMEAAHAHLLLACPSLLSNAQERLGFDSDVLLVVYVGIGAGAGWATRCAGQPAVLFGLEKIAECGWSQPPAVQGLIAQELGHLAHEHWRAQASLPSGAGPWWDLYEEGFAQRCEHVILGQETWHEAHGNLGENWLMWCQEHKGWLAAEFLRRVDAGESVKPFFGDWLSLQRHSQCGYFLGHEAIRMLEKEQSLRELALLNDVASDLKPVLLSFVE